MSNETYLTIRGNLGGRPNLHTGPSGARVLRFSVAVEASRFSRETGNFSTDEPQWFAVKAFGGLADNAGECLTRGTPVLIRGELVTEYWTDANQEKHQRQVIRADAIGVELRHGTAHFRKVLRNSPEAEATDGTPAPVDVSGAIDVGEQACEPAEEPGYAEDLEPVPY